MVNIGSKEDIIMKVIGQMERNKVLDNLFLVMEINILGILCMILMTEKENLYMQMEMFSKELGKMGKEMEEVI